MAYANGRLPSSELAAAYGGTQLRKDAAAGMNTLGIYARRRWKVNIASNGSTSDYRTYAQQEYWRNYWCSRGACGNAAVPGTSNHGWGIARDGNSVLQWVYRVRRTQMRQAGWGKTEAFHENWHFNWIGGFNRPNPGLDFQNPILRKGSGGPLQRGWVKMLQRRLKWAGYDVKVDGDFGRRTHYAVKWFQRRSRITDDGVVGAGTWKKLRDRKVRARHREMNRNDLRPRLR